VYVGRWKVFFNVFDVSSRGDPFVVWDFGTEGNISRFSSFSCPPDENLLRKANTLSIEVIMFNFNLACWCGECC